MCSSTTDRIADEDPARHPAALTAPTQVSTISSGLDHPWGLAFLPDGRYLVTERAGRMRLVGTSGSLTTISGVPAVEAVGQGGLLDVAIDPAFATNRLDIDQAGAIVCTPRSGQTRSNCSEVTLVKNVSSRIRDVRQGPDGYVYLLTDDGGNGDRLLRLQ